jgi:hypothetical protein
VTSAVAARWLFLSTDDGVNMFIVVPCSYAVFNHLDTVYTLFFDLYVLSTTKSKKIEICEFAQMPMNFNAREGSFFPISQKNPKLYRIASFFQCCFAGQFASGFSERLRRPFFQSS